VKHLACFSTFEGVVCMPTVLKIIEIDFFGSSQLVTRTLNTVQFLTIVAFCIVTSTWDAIIVIRLCVRVWLYLLLMCISSESVGSCCHQFVP